MEQILLMWEDLSKIIGYLYPTLLFSLYCNYLRAIRGSDFSDSHISSSAAFVSLGILWTMQSNKKRIELRSQAVNKSMLLVCLGFFNYTYTCASLIWNLHTFGRSHKCNIAKVVSSRLMTVKLSPWGLLIFFSLQGSHFKETFIAEVKAVFIPKTVCICLKSFVPDSSWSAALVTIFLVQPLRKWHVKSWTAFHTHSL